MSQRAGIRLRKRFKIKFRDIARLGRPAYPRAISAEKATRRMQDVIMKQQLMRSRKKA